MSGERQDPAEAKRLDKAVDTSEQPPTEPEPTEVTPDVEHDGGPVQELYTTAEPSES